ncbi:MAG: type III-B CRISPR module RAMP protein Cmr4 [Chloroflexi bacterium]|nr:type III-B CRISPR module RAMP protein Cmr4 [Chloroflexota bacterium]
MYTQQRFVLMTLDPVHIGTGGYRLGRVDLSIAREPGTNLPKIPGTSLAGAARSYAAMRYEKKQCAGQGQGKDDNKKHCTEATCPICYTFGSTKGNEGGNAGTVSIADAQILFFPVHSMAGPVWVTTAQRLNDAGFKVDDPKLARGKFATTLKDWNKALNLGWLLLEWQSAFDPPQLEILRSAQNDKAAWGAIEKRLVLVDDGLFSQIVNSNLEVRTSVSIDPNTGAAREGALFTYEAMPRATWLWCDVVEDDYRRDDKKPWPVTKKFNGQDNAGELLDEKSNETWNKSLHVAKAGLHLAEYLGVGGMGTRGFGRIKLMNQNEWVVSHV